MHRVALALLAWAAGCAVDRERTESPPVCDVCHGSDGDPAPPPDLEGNVDVGSIGVGAHTAHLTRHRLAPPLACIECHRVPERVGEPGHVDDEPAEVFLDPADGLAGAGGAEPVWDHATATCAGVYCHGVTLVDDSRHLIREPVWTRTDQAFCGACHGIPPEDGVHPDELRLTDCAACHPGTVDAYGNILVSSGPDGYRSEHIDGEVDL